MARTQTSPTARHSVAEDPAPAHGSNAPQPVRGLRDWLDHLAARDRLSVVKPNVDLRFELSAYAKRLADDTEKWGKVVKAAGLKPE